MFPSLRAAPWRLQRNRRRLDLMQWCFPTAWPNASPQDNCHSLSLKCRYKVLCLSQLHFSLTSCAWVLNTENTELLVNSNLCSNSWRKSSTKYCISLLRKISHTSKQEATLGPWKRNTTISWGCLQSKDSCHDSSCGHVLVRALPSWNNLFLERTP